MTAAVPAFDNTMREIMRKLADEKRRKSPTAESIHEIRPGPRHLDIALLDEIAANQRASRADFDNTMSPATSNDGWEPMETQWAGPAGFRILLVRYLRRSRHIETLAVGRLRNSEPGQADIHSPEMQLTPKEALCLAGAILVAGFRPTRGR